MFTDGEAEAVRNCSSKLGPVVGEGEDFTNAEKAGFPGCAKGKVDGKGSCCPGKGYGSVASLKCRPLQGSSVSGMNHHNKTVAFNMKVNMMYD